MLFPRHRRLIRRRFYRRPLLPFLIAATLAVDLVAAVLIGTLFARPGGGDPFLLMLSYSLLGLLVGQIGLLAIWATSSRSGMLGRLCICWLLGLALWLLVALSFRSEGGALVAYTLSAFTISWASCGVTQWIAGRWRRGLKPRGKRRVTIVALLQLTTIVALIATASRFGDFSFISDPGFLLGIITESLLYAMVLGVVLVCGTVTRSVYALLTLAALGLLFTSYVVSWWQPLQLFEYWSLYLFYLCQAVVIAVWLLGLKARRTALGVAMDEVKKQAPPAEEPAAQLVAELKSINVVV